MAAMADIVRNIAINLARRETLLTNIRRSSIGSDMTSTASANAATLNPLIQVGSIWKGGEVATLVHSDLRRTQTGIVLNSESIKLLDDRQRRKLYRGRNLAHATADLSQAGRHLGWPRRFAR
jgi:hypothetical protein